MKLLLEVYFLKNTNYFNIENILQKREWWNVLFYGESKGRFIWELRPELRDVIEECKNIGITEDGVNNLKEYL